MSSCGHLASQGLDCLLGLGLQHRPWVPLETGCCSLRASRPASGPSRGLGKPAVVALTTGWVRGGAAGPWTGVWCQEHARGCGPGPGSRDLASFSQHQAWGGPNAWARRTWPQMGSKGSFAPGLAGANRLWWWAWDAEGPRAGGAGLGWTPLSPASDRKWLHGWVGAGSAEAPDARWWWRCPGRAGGCCGQGPAPGLRASARGALLG